MKQLAAIALCALAISPIARAAVTVEETTQVTLLRGTTTLATLPSWETCRARALELIALETRTTGSLTFTCQTERRRIVAAFAPNPPPTCTAPKPADDQRPQTCPAGTTGQWTQTLTYTSAPHPTCWAPGEWTPTTAPAGACVPVQPAAQSTWYINAGGPAYSNYTADQHFSGGTASDLCPRITFSGVFRTRREHTGRFSYKVPVPNGSYNVRLLFRECYASAAGQRVQSASIEGQAIPAFDTFRSDNAVIIHERTVTVSDGFVDIELIPGKGMPIINGIDITPATAPEPGASQAMINWTPPTHNTDGTRLTDLSGFLVHWGLKPDELFRVSSPLPAGVTSHTVTNLTPGTWYFAVTVLSPGNQSAPSNAAAVTIR